MESLVLKCVYNTGKQKILATSHNAPLIVRMLPI